MSRMNRIRIVNLVYNHGSNMIGDITMDMDAKDTLIELQNGGGKSVLIQAITATLVQKKKFRDTKTRKFEELFSNGHGPTFIMVEWELDDHAGYMINGMMIKKNMDSNNTNPLLMTGFIGEYKYPCDYDIASLPIIETVNGRNTMKGYDSCKRVFESFKKRYPGLFTHYDMNSEQGKQYFKRLATFGVNHLEWENIVHRINEDESGVAELFSDCPTVRKMVEKWFLNLIEEKLNTNMDKMDNFRVLIETYILECIKNKESLKRKEQFDLFETKSETIRKAAVERDSVDENLKEKQYEIAAYMESLSGMQSSIQNSISEKNDQHTECEEEIRANTYGKYSAEYYEHLNLKNEAEEDMQELEEKLAGAERQKEKWTHEKHLLEASEQQSRFDERNAEYEHAYQKLLVSEKKEEELQPEREKLGYLIKQAYASEEKSCMEEIQKTDDELREKETAKDIDKKHAEETQNAIRYNAAEIGSLNTKMDAFESDKKAFESRWNVALNGADSIKKESANNSKRIDEQEKARTNTEENLAETKKRLDDLRGFVNTLDKEEVIVSHNLETAKSTQKKYDRELEYRKDVLKYLDLPESALFNTAKIMAVSDSKIDSISDQIVKQTSDLESLMKEQKKLETGAIDIDDDLKDVMNSLGIDILYGVDWLRNNGNSEEENRSLIKQNPYIPYALIMSKKEFDALQSVRSVYTSSPVPVVIRENLNAAASVDGIDFFMMFNENLLDPEKLDEMKAEIDRKIKKTRELKAIKENERNGYAERKANVHAQEVTETMYHGIIDSIERAENELKDIEKKRIATREEKAEKEKKIKELENELKIAGKNIDTLYEKKKELENLASNHEKYLINRERLADEEKKEKELKKIIDDLEKRIQLTDIAIRDLEGTRKDLEHKLQDIQSQASEYQIYMNEAEMEDGMTLEGMLARYKAINNTSKDMAELKENLKKADGMRNQEEKKLKSLMKRYNLHDGEWLSVRYSDDQMERAELLIKEFEREWNDTKNDISECKSRISWIEANIVNVEKEMKKIGYDEPMVEEELVIIDFDGRNKEIENELKDIERQIREFEHRQNFIENSLMALSEYGSFETNADVCVKIDNFKNEEFKKYTERLKAEYQKLFNLLNEKTSDFKDLMEAMMKVPEFADNLFKKPLERMKENPDNAVKSLEATLERHSQILRAVETDIQSIEKERDNILETMMTYLYDVHKEMSLIDKCSTIPVHDKNVKMLQIKLDSWEEFENIYRQRLKDRIMSLANECMDNEMDETEIHTMLGKIVTLKQLFDETIGIDNIDIKVYKIEEKTELLLSWNEAFKISGGEMVLTSFVVLSCLLYYMRRDNSNFSRSRADSKVVIMDNPYAKCSAKHLLDPLMEMAKKTNTQIISFTGHGSEDILHNFDNMCMLRPEKNPINDKIYITCENVNMNKLNFMQMTVHPAS